MIRQLLFGLFCLLLPAAAAQAKSLHWKAVDVEAHLDASGLLHVVETQNYVFDGDWNGGERTFRVYQGQSLKLEGVDRVDGGRIIPLRGGSVEKVDGYVLSENRVLRWRARMPEDPEFVNRELIYRIRYTLGGILRGRDRHYQLAHDFCFPDRPGSIQNYTLHFTLDPQWNGLPSPYVLSVSNLEPGKSMVVRGDLEFRGTALPANVYLLPSPWGGRVTLLLLCAGLVALFWKFYARERQAGRFASLAPLDEIDAAWLERNVFSHPPEVVGAAWDGKIGAAEVAAIIATLVSEKKIETSVESRFLRKPRLTMRLLVDRDSFTGYQRPLVNKLFFNNRVNTDTEAIRKHYKSSGLDLVKIIDDPVKARLEKLPGMSATLAAAPVNWKFTLLALAGAFTLLVIAGLLVDDRAGNPAPLAGLVGICSLILGSGAAWYNSRALTRLPLRFTLVLACASPVLVTTAEAALTAVETASPLLPLLAAALWSLAIFNVILGRLRITDPPEMISTRKLMCSARNYFDRQLHLRTPALRDEWFPYLLAVGLDRQVDGWFRSFGGSARVQDSELRTPTTGLSTSAGSKEPVWSGGGGQFGGGGASGSWAVAAAAVGSGVATPGSSGGSGGGSSGGGGGSSSGGGGGGGW